MIKLEEDVNGLFENNKNFTLRLDTVSTFKWDELITVGPYTDLVDIKGYNLNRVPNQIKHNDNFILFVFVNNKEGVEWMEINRTEKIVEFEKKNVNGIYKKQNCIFQINME